jgi:hypothetical protein
MCQTVKETVRRLLTGGIDDGRDEVYVLKTGECNFWNVCSRHFPINRVSSQRLNPICCMCVKYICQSGKRLFKTKMLGHFAEHK